MKIALTGTTGGLGRAICDAALAQGFGVRGLVREPRAAADLAVRGVTLVRGDLETPSALLELARGADVFIHSAAHVGDWGKREEFEQTNVGGTWRAIQAAADGGVKRFVHVSSVAVYGRPRLGIIEETFPTTLVGTPYEDTKIAAEGLVFGRARELGLEVTAIRPPVILGPHDRVFLPRLIRQLEKGAAVLINGGEGLFNLVDVDDVIDVLFRCATLPSAVGQAFNVAADPPRIRDLFDAIADGAGVRRARLSIPRLPAMLLARALDGGYRLAGSNHPPPVTPFVVTMMSLKVVYNARKARDVLGWKGAEPPLPRIRELAALEAKRQK